MIKFSTFQQHVPSTCEQNVVVMCVCVSFVGVEKRTTVLVVLEEQLNTEFYTCRVHNFKIQLL